VRIDSLAVAIPERERQRHDGDAVRLPPSLL
jgi:hypothetical protein